MNQLTPNRPTGHSPPESRWRHYREIEMNRNELEKKAATKGLSLSASVTDERLARIHPAMLNGRPDRLTSENAHHLDAPRETVAEWIASEYMVASYDLGKPGDEIVAPMYVDEDLNVVVLPSFSVVAVCTGAGQASDGDSVTSCEMYFTILRRPDTTR